MEEDKFYELVEKASQESKEDFLKFAKGIYGVDENIFEHIFGIPVIGRYDADEIVTTSLSTKTEDELLEMVNEAINGKDVWNDKEDVAKYFNLDESIKLNPQERIEWDNLIKENTVIVYNNVLFNESIKADSSKLSKEELYNKYKRIMKESITHERVHINNAYYDINLVKMTKQEIENEKELFFNEDEEILSYNEDAEVLPYSKDAYYEGMREEQQELNGAESSPRYDIDDSLEHEKYIDYWKDNNEVMVEAITQMMSNYENGDTLNKCLKKLLKGRDGKTIYPGVDDRVVLSTYILFTEELTEWMMFGAYNSVRENKLQKKIMDVCGTDMPLPSNKLMKNLEKYISTIDEESLSKEKVEMLEMLGVSINRKIDEDQMKQAATSEKALNNLGEAEVFIKNIQKENSKEKREER